MGYSLFYLCCEYWVSYPSSCAQGCDVAEAATSWTFGTRDCVVASFMAENYKSNKRSWSPQISQGEKGNTFWHFVRSFALADTSRHSWVWLLSFCQKVTSEKLWSESIDVLYIRRCHLYSALRKFDNFLGILFYKRLSLFLRGGVCVMMTIARYKRHENGLCAKQTKETFF